MSAIHLEVAILNPRQYRQFSICEPRFTIGRSQQNNAIVVDDPLVSEFQCRIEVLTGRPGCPLRVTNLGQSMVLENNARIHHAASRELRLPCCLGAGDTQIQIYNLAETGAYDCALRCLFDIGSSATSGLSMEQQNHLSPSPETLASWFEALGQIQRSATGQSEFFQLAARSIFNPGGLDGCLILQPDRDQWQIVAHQIPFPTGGVGYRRDLIARACVEKRPIFHDSTLLQEQASLTDLHVAVVCPVLDEQQQVAAIIYGFRNNSQGNSRRGIRVLEARFVELVADCISAGFIRLAREADCARQRVLLEQAFPPDVVDQLQANPNCLKGQYRHISVLFADLRNFCRISEAIGPDLTYQLLSDVLEHFTQIIYQHQGVVIDYYGDGLSAFWNAPLDQPDHARLACQAGLAIEQAMTDLNAKWFREIGHRLRVGIGIHSGGAQVGNSGSAHRLKYGPQGSTVNIASRLEQTTKCLGINLLVSRDTAREVTGQFVPQKVCTATLPGFASPFDLMKIVEPHVYAQQTQFYSSYQQALHQFESGQWTEACQTLTEMAQLDEYDGPMLEFLLTEVNQRLFDHTASDDNCATTHHTHRSGLVLLEKPITVKTSGHLSEERICRQQANR